MSSSILEFLEHFPHAIGITPDGRHIAGYLVRKIEVQVDWLVNLGKEPIRIEPGQRVAQLVIAPVVQADFALVDQLSDTERGAGGFGSTGAK